MLEWVKLMSLERYAQLFVSRQDAYARQLRDGRYYTVREPVTPNVLKSHLRGTFTAGWYAISQAGTVKWGCVDVDGEKSELLGLSYRLSELDLDVYIEDSRRGGHLWLFCEPMQPRPIRKLLVEATEGKAEVFPKQVQTSGFGSLVRGPLGVHQKTGERYGWLDPLTLNRIGGSMREELEYLDGVTINSGVKIAQALAAVLDWRGSGQRIDIAKPDIITIASMFTELKPRGKYFVGCCPLHPEAHPSFAVYPNDESGQGRWYCFHEGRGGDSVSLYARVKGISYREALAELKG